VSTPGMEREVADGVTAWVPDTAIDPLQAPLAVQAVALVDVQSSVVVEPRAIDAGLTEKLTVGAGGVTSTIADPDFEVSSVDVAMIVAVPEAAAVNTPLLLTDPMLDGLTDHVTELLKLPVPATVATQEDVWVG